MIEKVLESSIGASSGAGWPSSCTCMKNHRLSVQAWRGYDCAVGMIFKEVYNARD